MRTQARGMSDFERCAALRVWRLTHSGGLPKQRSDSEYEKSLARWLSKALERRHRALSSRPSQRQLTPDEAVHLDSIVGMAVEDAPASCLGGSFGMLATLHGPIEEQARVSIHPHMCIIHIAMASADLPFA